jgi:hypothetical protein
MFDILSTAALTVGAAIVVAFLSHALAETPRGRLTIAGALVLWFGVVLIVGASGLIGPAELGTPGLGAAVILPAAALTGLFAFVPLIRGAMGSVSLPALIAVHAIRVLGVIFVALYAQGRVPAPFAPSAGWGDIAVGVTALPVAALIARFGSRVRLLALLWNFFGLADLINAVALGALSAPGPAQLFIGPPTSALMTTAPWLIIPGFLVPCLMFIHIVIFVRFANGKVRTPADAWRVARAATPA